MNSLEWQFTRMLNDMHNGNHSDALNRAEYLDCWDLAAFIDWLVENENQEQAIHFAKIYIRKQHNQKLPE